MDKATHAKITGYYKKIYGNTGLSLRDWLVGQPFEIQYQVGTDVLKMFGVIQ